jgi:hypothetical protein
MYKKILLISSILLSVLMASSTYANNSGRYSWWNNFFGGHNHECHTIKAVTQAIIIGRVFFGGTIIARIRHQ